MIGLLEKLGNHVIFEIDPECDIVRHPVFRSYTNIKSSHVFSRYRWTILGSSETDKDKGVESTLGHEVIEGVDMIKSNVHSTHGTSELSFLVTRLCPVINVTVYRFQGAFNTKMPREIVAQPSAKYGPVFQILTVFEEIVPSEQTRFK